MATMTAPELLQWLGANLFLPAAQVDELRAQLSSLGDGHALAKELIRRNWLSPYQVNQILQNKGAQLIVGANRLLERIGEGSMGQVFKAWNTRLGRIVAVKMIHKEHVANKKAMDRFRREIETASQLDHPNIVLVRDAGEDGDRPYLVMDFIHGIDLSQRVKQQGPLSLAEAVTYAHQAALGLQHAFERGVVHRDIKPGNLLLASGEGRGPKSEADARAAALGPLAAPLNPRPAPLIKILDFGLSRFDSETHNSGRLTHAGNLLGTVDYIAPEQAQDAHSADTRADIYSLGCTLFFLLTGKPPFPGATLVEKIIARSSGDPPSVRSLRPDVPAGLDAVIQRLMAREPEQRYQSPMEAAQALAPFTRLTSGEIETATLSQAELAAALAPRQIAQAILVTRPVPADVPVIQAPPVAQPLPVNEVPVVQTVPVAAPNLDDVTLVEAIPMPAGSPAAENELLHADAVPMATPMPSALPVAQPLAASHRQWLLGGGGAAALLILVIVIIVLMQGSGPTGPGRYGPGATLKFRAVEPMPMTLREGRKTPVIVTIQRKDFSGPVTVSFEKLPNGLQSAEITIKDRQDRDQLYLMASFNSGIRKEDLRLVAVAGKLRVEIKLPVTVVTNQNEPVSD